jgi:hypothetical protein
MISSSSRPTRGLRTLVAHRSILEIAGIAWILGAAFVVTSQLVRRKTSLPSGVASTTQVIGVVAFAAAVLGMVWGLIALAKRVLLREKDLLGAVIISAVVAGILLLPLLIGGTLLFPGLAALVLRGRLSHANVRLPAAAVLAGLMIGGIGFGWQRGLEGPVPLNILVFLGAAAEGAALIWFGRTTEPSGLAG